MKDFFVQWVYISCIIIRNSPRHNPKISSLLAWVYDMKLCHPKTLYTALWHTHCIFCHSCSSFINLSIMSSVVLLIVSPLRVVFIYKQMHLLLSTLNAWLPYLSPAFKYDSAISSRPLFLTHKTLIPSSLFDPPPTSAVRSCCSRDGADALVPTRRCSISKQKKASPFRPKSS